jgi:C1A family cysteine protease
MKKILLTILLINYLQPSNSQGLKPINQSDLNEIDRFESSMLGFSGDLPSNYSLEKYVPPVLNQGETSTCVGFAMGYYGISTIHNAYFDRSNEYEKLIHSFDPYYAYTLNDSNCDNGLNMLDAFRNFSIYGAKKMFFSPVDIDCDNPINDESLENIQKYLSPYQLEKFEFIQTYNSRFIENVKTSIFNKLPVMIGTDITESLYDVGSKEGNVSWTPKGDEKSIGGHAMCVVGYDDDLNGGSFRIVNSWGSDWGENGFFWLSYDDFYDKVSEAYVIKPYRIDFENQDKIVYFYEDYLNINSENDSFNYEGVFDENGPNGFGVEINKSKENRHASIGKFVNGKRDGKHLLLNESSIFRVTYEMGEITESQDLGFASDQNQIERQLMKFGRKLNVKRPSSKEIDSIIKKGSVGKWKIKKRTNVTK